MYAALCGPERADLYLHHQLKPIVSITSTSSLAWVRRVTMTRPRSLDPSANTQLPAPDSRITKTLNEGRVRAPRPRPWRPIPGHRSFRRRCHHGLQVVHRFGEAR